LIAAILFWAAWFAAAVAIAAATTARLIGWAGALGVVDRPNARSSHTKVTPRGGGLAIVAVTVLAAIAAGILYPSAALRLAAIVIPAVAIAAVSWIDDIRTLQNRVRFSVHLAAAVAVTAILGPIREVDLGSFGSLELGAAAWPLTILWIVGLTNAFNFMDGIDGIAGITAATAGAGLAIAAWLLGGAAIAVVSLAFAGAALGFLSQNWPPARIFMGDVGSAFCGFLIAVLPLGMPAADVPRIVPVAVLAMWPFIFDTLFTLLRRLLRGENVFQAHRSHLYQRLVIAGWSHRATSSLYGSLAAMATAIGVTPLLNPDMHCTADPAAAALIASCSLFLVGLAMSVERWPPSTPAS
jgi:UDP-N-acetylmuramyl pentapeptide phosphotransferase/UDP-N-acetylglucosamine-1-phosphate transferase